MKQNIGNPGFMVLIGLLILVRPKNGRPGIDMSKFAPSAEKFLIEWIEKFN